jgi:hypothetical protein
MPLDVMRRRTIREMLKKRRFDFFKRSTPKAG